MTGKLLNESRPILGFVHIPKTAGTTLKFILRNSTYCRHCDLQTTVRHGTFRDEDYRFMRKVFFFGLRSIAGHSLIHPTANLSAPIQYFTFLREPFARCLSQYEQIRRGRVRSGRDLSFEEFMRIPHMRDQQVYHIAGEYSLEKAKKELSTRYLFVGLTERFLESMLVLRQLAPFRLKVEFERLHVAKDKTVRQQVLDDPASRRLLEEGNQLDAQLYAWARDELYPALRAKAGIEEAELDESDFRPRGFPLRYKLTRGFNMAVYRSLSKLRRVPDYKTRTLEPAPVESGESGEKAAGNAG